MSLQGLNNTKSPFHPLFFMDKITAGFPSPASDYLESSLDLNEFLIKNPLATYLKYFINRFIVAKSLPHPQHH